MNNLKENARNYLWKGANKIVLAITLTAMIGGIALLTTADYLDIHYGIMATLLIAPFFIFLGKSLFRRKGQ